MGWYWGEGRKRRWGSKAALRDGRLHLSLLLTAWAEHLFCVAHKRCRHCQGAPGRISIQGIPGLVGPMSVLQVRLKLDQMVLKDP